MPAMSKIFSIGFDGVSSQTSFVAGRTAARTAAGSLMSRNVASTPNCFITLSKIRNVPPYTSSPTRTWSPLLSRRRMAIVAAQPLPNATPCFPPSSAAKHFSRASRVGLPARE